MRTVALAWTTPRAWACRALAEPLALLADHAWCELGAASSAQGLVARTPDLVPLPEHLIPLAAEELRHFRRVERLLRARGGRLGAARRNPYADGLLAGVERRRGAAPLERVLDRLLASALIETRSLERFALLAEEAADPELAALWAELGTAEAAHASLFLELACELFPAARVEARLSRWVALEARVLRALPPGPAVHSGWFEILSALSAAPGAPGSCAPEFEIRPRKADEKASEVPR